VSTVQGWVKANGNYEDRLLLTFDPAIRQCPDFVLNSIAY